MAYTLPPATLWALLLWLVATGLTTTFPAHAQAPQPKPEESCGDIERSYDMIRADAVAMQTNIALFAAADRGCSRWRRSSLQPAARCWRATGAARCRSPMPRVAGMRG